MKAIPNRLSPACLTQLLVAAAIGTPASAQYVLFENFEDASPGLIDGQGGWDSAGGDNRVVADPLDASNQVVYIPSSSSTLHRSLHDVGLEIPDGAQRMLFFRMCVAEKQTFSVGLSPMSSPREYSDFATEIGMANSAQNLDLRVWDDGEGNYTNVAQLAAGTWHNVWVRVDTAADVSMIWMNSDPGADASPSDLLTDADGDDRFLFRSGRSSDLVSFFVKTSGGSSGTNFGPIYLDDIYVEFGSSQNLTNPAGGACLVDFDGNGLLDLADIGSFATGFLGGDPSFDLTGDLLLDLEDINVFVALFLAGCP